MPISRRVEAVAPLAARLERPITLVDAGVRGGVGEAWLTLEPHLVTFGFDPDAEECARLAAEHEGRPGFHFVPLALGAERRIAQLYRTAEPACSSIYPPHPVALRTRGALACARLVGTAAVPMCPLDAWAAEAGVEFVDAIKIDTQGAELDVLRGAERTLRSVRAIELEVTFNPIYEGQPLFGDIDRFLRERGFALWRLRQLVHYGSGDGSVEFELPERQFSDDHLTDFPALGGQLYWGHAYYVAEDLAYGESPPIWRDRLRDACLAAALGFRDLAGWALARAASTAPRTVVPAIEAALGG